MRAPEVTRAAASHAPHAGAAGESSGARGAGESPAGRARGGPPNGRESGGPPPSSARVGPSGGAVYALPAGYVGEDGAIHAEAELAPLTGRDEEFLSGLPDDICAAAAVTALLGRCLLRVGAIEPAGEQLARELLVRDRDFLMLKLREAIFGPRVDAVLRCRACSKPMDVNFSLADVEVESRPLAARYFGARLSPAGGFRDGAGVERREVEFRLPTGADQEAAAAAFREGESSAREQLLARLVRPPAGADESGPSFVARLPEAARAEIEEQMARLAPATEIELDGACPECGEPFETTFDLTGFFAAEMRNNLRTLERSVHLLAFHYHWSEGEILSLTRRKRQRYLELVEEELAR